MSLLTRRAVVLAKVETTRGVDASPVPATDAMLVADPDYTTDLNVLERDFVRNDLSPLGHTIGRKLAGATFTVEMRSNGLTNSGSVADAAVLGTLFRGCGYSETGISGVGTIGAIRMSREIPWRLPLALLVGSILTLSMLMA